MKGVESAQEFLMWLTSAAGLSIVVPFVVNFMKKYINIEGWQAMAMTLLVATALGGGAVLALESGAYKYLEEYWGLIVAVISVAFGGSQVVYHLAPRSGSGNDGK